MVQSAVNAINTNSAATKAVVFSWWGVFRLARKTSSFTKSRKASSPQPNQAKVARK